MVQFPTEALSFCYCRLHFTASHITSVSNKFSISTDSGLFQLKWKKTCLCVCDTVFEFPGSFIKTKIHRSDQNVPRTVPIRILRRLKPSNGSPHSHKTIAKTDLLLVYTVKYVPRCPANGPPAFGRHQEQVDCRPVSIRQHTQLLHLINPPIREKYSANCSDSITPPDHIKRITSFMPPWLVIHCKNSLFVHIHTRPAMSGEYPTRLLKGTDNRFNRSSYQHPTTQRIAALSDDGSFYKYHTTQCDIISYYVHCKPAGSNDQTMLGQDQIRLPYCCLSVNRSGLASSLDSLDRVCCEHIVFPATVGTPLLPHARFTRGTDV